MADAGTGILILDLEKFNTEIPLEVQYVSISEQNYSYLSELADQRPTQRGDNLYFDDNGQLTHWGVPIVQADFLDEPDNGFEEQTLMADPDSIVFGFLNEIESETNMNYP